MDRKKLLGWLLVSPMILFWICFFGTIVYIEPKTMLAFGVLMGVLVCFMRGLEMIK